MTRRASLAADTLPMFEVVDSSPVRVAVATNDRIDGADTSVTVTTGERTDFSALPAVIDVETAGRLLGLGRSAAYQLVKDGAWPTPVLRLGRRWRVVTAPLLALLGIEGLEPSPAGATLPASPTAPAIFRHDQGDQR